MLKRLVQAGSMVMLMACASVEFPASAQQAASPPPATQPAPCAGAEFHHMDFWLGSWDVRWDASPGQPAGQGTNVVTRDFDGCVIHEHFNGGSSTGSLLGESWSLYHAPTQHWRQTWVDNQGGYFALMGGLEGDKFILISKSVSDNTPRQRMVYEDITPNSFTWRWQGSTDRGATWTDSWVIHYTRQH
jgi:hypothetical protein